MTLALAIATQDFSARHVRSTDPKILEILEAGISGSATFRCLIATLDASDVIVYVTPKLTRRALDGYLSYNVVAQGQYRYLRIAIAIAGPAHRLVPLLAHELQHAVEVARAPDARDTVSVERMFRRLAIELGCDASNCFETQAALDAEHIVKDELARR